MRLSIQRGDVKIDVEAEGPEVGQLLQQLLASGASGTTTATPLPPPPPLSSPVILVEGKTDADIFRRLHQTLGAAPRRVLAVLFDHPKGLPDVDLKAALLPAGITTIAGSMTAIVKGAKRLGIRLERVLEKSHFRDRERGGYFFYKLGRTAREVMAEKQLQVGERNGQP